MSVFIVPIVDCYHNLTKGFGYLVAKIEYDVTGTSIIYIHDDNNSLTVIQHRPFDESFVLMEA